MRIEIRAHGVPVSEDLRRAVARRFRRIDRQVSALAELTLEVFEDLEAAESHVAEATLALKGVTLRARSGGRDLRHAIVAVSEQLDVQVKRHRDKRRHRREARTGGLTRRAAALAAEVSPPRTGLPLAGGR